VLKITTNRENEESFRVRLCGQFTGEYIPALQQALTVDSAGLSTVVLDLLNVTFVDREAMVFLCTVKSGNIVIENIPSYVTRWIEQERRCGSSQREFQDE
jgi:hypothetical protein